MDHELRLHIDSKVRFAEGMTFGKTGAYERLIGRVDYALDPADPRLAHIVDLDLAPRNAKGLVEFSGDLDILKPVDMARGNRRILYEVSNRGNRSALRSFNNAPQTFDPKSPADAGDGFLMAEGYTVVLSGWQGDLVAQGGGFMTAALPVALKDGKPLRGIVRQEFIVDKAGTFSLPVSGLANIKCYRVLDPSKATLTVRERELDERRPVPEDQWMIAKDEKDDEGRIRPAPSDTDLFLSDGFKPGWIYELIYETEGSRVMGLGLAGTSELVSFLRFGDADADGRPNPLAGAIDRAYGYGGSLSARVVRQFVYEGFNGDRQGRKVFEAVYPHLSGGGRVWINQRFAQVGRFPRQHEEHQYPSEYYPFAYSQVPDAFSDKLDSVLKRPATDPLVMHTHTSSEYWQRHASLGQVDPRTGADVQEPDSVRMYYLTGSPHGAGVSAHVPAGEATFNGHSSTPFMRACLTLMDRWATTGEAPPPSRLPRRADGSLTSWKDVLAKWPKPSKLRLPDAPSRLPLLDYGPDFDNGIVTEQPPKLTGKEYTLYVPAIDGDGNEAPGLRSPDLQVPVGSFTGWYVRPAGMAEGDLLALSGSFIPFARTKAEREQIGDPRRSIEERYASHDAYVDAVRQAADSLVADCMLLREDADKYVAAAKKRNPLDPSVPLLPLLGDA